MRPIRIGDRVENYCWFFSHWFGSFFCFDIVGLTTTKVNWAATVPRFFFLLLLPLSSWFIDCQTPRWSTFCFLLVLLLVRFLLEPFLSFAAGRQLGNFKPLNETKKKKLRKKKKYRNTNMMCIIFSCITMGNAMGRSRVVWPRNVYWKSNISFYICRLDQL